MLFVLRNERNFSDNLIQFFTFAGKITRTGKRQRVTWCGPCVDSTLRNVPGTQEDDCAERIVKGKVGEIFRGDSDDNAIVNRPKRRRKEWQPVEETAERRLLVVSATTPASARIRIVKSSFWISRCRVSRSRDRGTLDSPPFYQRFPMAFSTDSLDSRATVRFRR